MQIKLALVRGQAQSPEFQIELPSIIGRSRKAAVVLADALVSRQHCELFASNGEAMVRDLGSLNGTFVGRDRVSAETPLPPGALLTVGGATFRAVYEKVNESPTGSNGSSTAGSPAVDVTDATLATVAAMPAVDESDMQFEPVDDGPPLVAKAEAAETNDTFDLRWLSDEAEPAAAEAASEADSAFEFLQPEKRPNPNAAEADELPLPDDDPSFTLADEPDAQADLPLPEFDLVEEPQASEAPAAAAEQPVARPHDAAPHDAPPTNGASSAPEEELDFQFEDADELLPSPGADDELLPSPRAGDEPSGQPATSDDLDDFLRSLN